MVDRYIINYDGRGEQLHPSGDFVHYSDYAALEAQLAEAKAAMRAVYDWMNQLPIPTAGCTSKMQLLYDALSALEGLDRKGLLARIAELEAQLAKAKEALEAIDALSVMEINPSNYDHDDVCELNSNACEAAIISRDALSALEDAPPAPKVMECAAEGCAQTATVRFERGGAGSDYCHGCYMRIKTLTAVQEAGRW